MPACDLDPDHDPRLVPVFQLARACGYEAAHSQQVTRLALELFDQLGALHELDAQARFHLVAGGLLHDIGWIEGQKAHHKTALRLITTSTLLPWEARERGIVGSIARYHRKALPKMKHDHFAALSEEDRAVVMRLAALLRLADGMDRSHCSIVRGIRATVASHTVTLEVTAAGPVTAASEREYAARKADLFEQTYGRPITWQWHAAAEDSGVH